MRVKHETSEARFGNRVQTARKDRGWSQEALARHLKEAAGVELHQSAIARLERGERAIRFNEATALAKVLDIDLRPFAGNAIEPLLTEDDYERVKKAAEDARNMEKELDAAIRRHKAEMDAVVSDLEYQLRTAAEVRWKMDMAIVEYEESRRRG